MSYIASADTPPANWHLLHRDAGATMEVRLFDPNRDGSLHLGPFRGLTCMNYGGERRRGERGAFWEEADAFAWARAQVEDLMSKGWELKGMSARSKTITENEYDFERMYGQSTRTRVGPWETCSDCSSIDPANARSIVKLPMENNGRLRDVLELLAPTARLLINGEPAIAVEIEADELGNQTPSRFINLRTAAADHRQLATRRLARREVISAGGLQRLTKGVNRAAPTLANARLITGVRIEVNPRNCTDDAEPGQILGDSRFINFLTS